MDHPDYSVTWWFFVLWVAICIVAIIGKHRLTSLLAQDNSLNSANIIRYYVSHAIPQFREAPFTWIKYFFRGPTQELTRMQIWDMLYREFEDFDPQGNAALQSGQSAMRNDRRATTAVMAIESGVVARFFTDRVYFSSISAQVANSKGNYHASANQESLNPSQDYRP